MSTFSSQPIVIDGKGHLLGRLASIISKQVSIAVWIDEHEDVEEIAGWCGGMATTTAVGEGLATLIEDPESNLQNKWIPAQFRIRTVQAISFDEGTGNERYRVKHQSLVVLHAVQSSQLNPMRVGGTRPRAKMGPPPSLDRSIY